MEKITHLVNLLGLYLVSPFLHLQSVYDIKVIAALYNYTQ